MKVEKKTILFMGILAVAVMVTSIVAFGYGIEMGGGYKGTYADVYRKVWIKYVEEENK